MSIINIEDHTSNQLSAKELIDYTRDIFKSGKTLSTKFRQTQLKNLMKCLEENEEKICELTQEDFRRPKHEILMELRNILNEIKYILYHLNDWVKPEELDVIFPYSLADNYIHKEPYGIVLIIGAWNLPFQLCLSPLAGAIAAGNCAILKPSELAPTVAKFLATSLNLYLDSDCYSVYLGGVSETTELLQERFDYIFYTGSTRVGKIIHQAANKHLTPVTLELGGKSPAYIDDSADFLIATRRILWGKCYNGGQLCIAPDYLICTKQVQERFLVHVPKVIEEFFTKDVKQSPDFARIISDQHFRRLLALMQNGTVAFGGDYNAENHYIQPTILIDVHPNDSIMQEEIFGPILPIINVKNVKEAIKFINSREKPLALYVFSKRNNDVNLIIKNTSSGGISVNDTLSHTLVSKLPFGGVGYSGMGAYHGKYSFDTFSHEKSVMTRNYNRLSEKLVCYRYPPYTEKKTAFLSKLIQERRGIPLKMLKYLLLFMCGMITACILHKI